MKRNLIFFAKICFSFAVLFFLFKKIDFDSWRRELKDVSLYWFFLSLAASLFAWLVNSKKWQLILNALGLKRNLLGLFKLNLASIFYASILPGGQLTGEGMKCYRLIQDGREKAKLLFSVLADRITGFSAVIFLGLTSVLASRSDFGSRAAFSFFFAAAFSFFSFFFYIFLLKKNDCLGGFLSGFLNRWGLARKDFQFKFGEMAGILAFSLFFQILNTLSIIFLAYSVNLEMNFLDLFWVYALVSMLLLFPFAFMGLGIREGSFVFLLGMLGVSANKAISLSLLAALICLITGLAGGGFELVEKFELGRIANKK